MARPLAEVNADDVVKLAAMGCTNTEIAAFCDCSVDTITRRFAEEIAKGREQGKTKLRRLQWKSAEAGNVAMQIWLGKQYLGQSDKMEQKNTNTPDEKSDEAIDDRIRQLMAKIDEPK